MRHPGAPTEALFLADRVAGRSLARHTGCHGSFSPLYCGRSIMRRRSGRKCIEMAKWFESARGGTESAREGTGSAREGTECAR